jgi:hypothetical protein
LTRQLGDLPGGFHGYAIAERWNGSSWTLEQLPRIADTELVELTSVACPSAERCVAVGLAVLTKNFQVEPVAETWNGKSWERQPMPANSPEAASLTCASATSCLAVGTIGESTLSLRGTIRPLEERWNGARWRTITLAAAPRNNFPILDSVSCSAVTACTAFGERVAIHIAPTAPQSSISFHTFAERWNGKQWSVETTPAMSGTSTLQVAGVSCATARRCAVVGYDGNDWVRPWSEMWDGTRWEHQALPPRGQALLLGVSCTSDGACTAVGAREAAGRGAGTLAETTTGSGWTVDTTPAVLKSSRDLAGVACSDAAHCVAVGERAGRLLVEQS